jgi:serine/threonine protein phosphatase PrpC
MTMDGAAEDFGAAGVEDMVQFELAIMSKVGGRKGNEDACGHWHSDERLCCVVSDGAGGHGGGDVASQHSVRYVIEKYAAAPTFGVADIEPLLRGCNADLRAHRADGEAQRDMHATIVSLFLELDSQTAIWGHVGDSRLYLFRGGRLSYRTRDHSVVQMLADEGKLREDEMRTHSQRSELLCALGTEDADLRVGVARTAWDIAPGDVFLLCTDGVWEHLEDRFFERSLALADDPDAWLALIEAEVLRQTAGRTRYDNFSAVTLWARPAA